MLREVTSNEFFTVLLVICLALIAVAKSFFPKRFNDFFYVLGNFKYLKIYVRDQKFFDKFEAILFANLVITSTIFIFLAYNSIVESLDLSFNLLFKMAIGIASFILIKVLIERLIGSLFEIDELIDKYIFQKISYKNFLGLFLLPINVILIYSITPSASIMLGFIILFLLINIFSLVSSFKKHQNLIKNNFFYFILYLCALEIAPYIMLYKVFSVN